MAKTDLSYSSALKEMEDILKSIENSELDVDELSKKVKRVSFLIRFCREKLKKTEAEVENTLSKMDEEAD